MSCVGCSWTPLALGAIRSGEQAPHRVTLDEGRIGAKEPPADVVALDDALTALAVIDERKGQVVEMRYFGGLSVEEAAEALGVSVRTVKRDWTMAKLWLVRELKKRWGLGIRD